MANICNLSVDLGNLQNEIVGKLGTLLNLQGLIGTPPGLLALQGILQANLIAIQAALAGVLPAIPFASELSSLRDAIGDLAGGLVGNISGLLDQFGGIIDIDANINLLDLANSAIRFGVNFDPCSLTSGIPNIVRDGAGNFIQMPNIQPNLGKTDFGELISLPDIPFTNPLNELNLANTSFDAITDAASGIEALRNNVTGSITGMGNTLRKLPTGEQVFQTQSQYIADLKARASNLVERNTPTVEQFNEMRKAIQITSGGNATLT